MRMCFESVVARVSPVFDEGLEVVGEVHAVRQHWRVFLEHFGEDLKVRLAVLVRELSCG